MATKRGRQESHVLFSCFDEPDRLVEVDMVLLREFGCRMAALVEHTEPEEAPSGKRFYRCGMSRAMLITVINSLRLGELCTAKGVAVGEALATLRFEGVFVGAAAASCVKRPRLGVAFPKGACAAHSSLCDLCAQVADAILFWPRLEAVMDLALSPTPSSFSASHARAWIRFSEKPAADDQSPTATFATALASKNARWLHEGVAALGSLQARIAEKFPGFLEARDETSFRKLLDDANADPLGPFFATQFDVCKSACDSATRRHFVRGERFWTELRQTVIAAAQGQVCNPVHVQYAKAVITAVENTLTSSPCCACIFSAAMADEKGSTPERTALKRALKARGVEVLRWADSAEPGIKALAFPPGWRDPASKPLGPAVLLAFDSLRK